MRTIDLSHVMETGMTVFPGSPQPQFAELATVPVDGFSETFIGCSSHCGTHIDVPSHMLMGRASIDQIDVSQLTGWAQIIDIRAKRNGDKITVEDLRPYEKKIQAADFLVFWSGFDRHWGQDVYCDGFPTLTYEAAKWLSSFSLKALAIDALSFDEMGGKEFIIHRTMLGSETLLIENLCGIEQLASDRCFFVVLPLKWQNGDGSPVRVCAIEGIREED